VKLNDVIVPNGTQIRAIIEGYVYQTTTVSTAPPAGYGPSSFSVIIPKPEGKSYDGKTVTFLIGNYLAAQTATWTVGGNIAVNLTATTQ
jgi:hypothetical protein